MDTNNIRSARIVDAARLAEIYNYYILHTTVTFEVEPVTADEMARRIAEISADYPYYVYESDGRVIGYTYAHPWNKRAAAKGHSLETTVYLDHEAKHEGVGSALMNHLIERCKTEGYHALIANVTDENQASQAFHESLGFKQVAYYTEVGRKFNRWLGIKAFEKML